MRRFLLVGVVGLVFGASGSLALAQTIDTPYGYEGCGFRDFTNGGWTYSPESGASVSAYARGMSCTSARRNVSRLKFGRKPPYKAYRPGYTCKQLVSAYEFSDIRCTKRETKRVSFRTRSGA